MKIKYLTLNAYWNKFIKIFTARKERHYFCRENRLLLKKIVFKSRIFFCQEKKKIQNYICKCERKKKLKLTTEKANPPTHC